jgi:hypothetical protein
VATSQPQWSCDGRGPPSHQHGLLSSADLSECLSPCLSMSHCTWTACFRSDAVHPGLSDQARARLGPHKASVTAHGNISCSFLQGTCCRALASVSSTACSRPTALFCIIKTIFLSLLALTCPDKHYFCPYLFGGSQEGAKIFFVAPLCVWAEMEPSLA